MIEIHAHASACEPGDLLACDPPYSPHVHASAVSNNPGGLETGTRKRDLGFDALSPALLNILAGLIRGTRRWSAVFSDIESVGAVWQPAAPDLYVRSVPWVRWSQPQKSGDRPCSGCEMVCLFGALGKKQWNGPGGLTHFEAKALRGKDKHPTEKPLDLMLSIISHFSNPGDLVVDPTMGSGTTGVAAVLLGRKFRGAELQDAHRNWAEARIHAAAELHLSVRDRERAERWVEYMLGVYEHEVSATPKAMQRRNRALRDVETIAERLGL